MIVSYMISAIKYAIVFICIYIVVRKNYSKKKQKDFNLIREIPYLIFGAYVVALLSQTVLPIWHVFTLNGKISVEISTYHSRNLNLIPFKTILGYITGANNIYRNANMAVRIVNLLGNVCLFIPFGMLFPFAFVKCSRLKLTFVYGILLSFFIEVMQFFVERSSDIDDVILNGIGVIIGYGCYKVYQNYIRENVSNIFRSKTSN